MKFNKKFSVEVDPHKEVEPEMEDGARYGVITIGDFYEYFYMSPADWAIADYEKQWQLALKRFEKKETTCFIVNVQFSTPLVEMWALYKVGDTVFLQNYLIVEDEFEKCVGVKGLSPINSFNIIPEREIYTESGQKISEWSMKIDRSI